MIKLYNEDCIGGMKKLENNSVDLILADLPYNVTDCAWDKSKLDLNTMWEEIKRILKPCSSVILFGSGKFGYKLVSSNYDWYKYKWLWIKNTVTAFAHAKNAPMHQCEEILVFSNGSIQHKNLSTRRMKYNPQGVKQCEYLCSTRCLSNTQARGGSKYFRPADKNTETIAFGGKFKGNADKVFGRNGRLRAFGSVYAKRPSHQDYYLQEQTGYPTDVLYFDAPHNVGRFHPTQKPVDLLEYLIRTYTDSEDETVLDITMGSGSTGVAAVNTGRNFIGYEIDKKFFDIAVKRIEEAVNEKEQSLFNLRQESCG